MNNNKIEVGERYRILDDNEIVRKGDEVFHNNKWTEIIFEAFENPDSWYFNEVTVLKCKKYYGEPLYYRRKIIDNKQQKFKQDMKTNNLKPAYIKGADFISITHNGVPTTIFLNDARFVKVNEIIKNQKWDELDIALNTAKAIAKYSAGKVQVFDGIITYNGKEVHNSVVTRILEFIKEGFPFEPLVNFLDKLMENPNENSRNQLYNYLEKYKLPLTDSGNFLAAKTVRKDTFLDKYTGTIEHSVGNVIKMDRKLCDENENNGCAQSLHCGNYSYVISYGSPDDEAILVEVNPKDVVACPKDCDWQKLRVCEYKVVKHIGKVKDLNEFGCNYAPKTEQAKLIPNVKKVKTSDVKYVGADVAYAANKAGKTVKTGNIIVKEFKPRSFFRKYSNWTIAE